MNNYEGQQILPLPAGADLDDGVFVKIDTGEWVLATSADAEGVTTHSAATGEEVKVCVSGPCDVRTSSALTVGGRVEADGDSRAVDAGGTTGDIDMGLALEAGGATTATVPRYAKILIPNNKIPAA